MLNLVDMGVFVFINKIQNPLLTNIMVFFTTLGDKGVLWIMLVIILLLMKKTRKYACIILISVIITLILNNILKSLFDRVRPYEYFHFIPMIKTSGSASFPSAHTSIAFAVFGIYNFFKLRYRYLVGVVALLTGISRFYLEVHYFTDVIAGGMLGMLVSYAVIYLYYRSYKIREFILGCFR